MKRAFTIVEVLVVIGIIAILTVLIFPSINDIRKKNRDAERISDISAIQLGLSLYYAQHSDTGYPTYLNDLAINNKYVPSDSLITPEGGEYSYIPLTKSDGTDPKCTFYHLGIELELPSAQLDSTDSFDSSNLEDISNGYTYCGATPPDASGLAPGGLNYNVHP